MIVPATHIKIGPTSDSEADPWASIRMIAHDTYEQSDSLKAPFASRKEPVKAQDIRVVITVDVLDIGAKRLVAKT
jgi:hypothetical protein